MSFCPVVTGTTLTKDEVVRSEKVSERTGTESVHGTRFEIDENSTRDILVGGYFVIVHVDTLQLKVEVSFIETLAIDTVLVGHDFPEFGTDLVTALPSLEVNDFTHDVKF
jgi:hypothetical protein